MRTKVYELNEEEQVLVEGFRRGRVILDKEEWVKLSEKEQEAVDLWRRSGYGTITIEVAKGEPVVSSVLLEFRHGKLQERAPALELLPKLAEGHWGHG